MDIKELLKSKKSLSFINYMKKLIDINWYSTAYSNLLGFTIDGNRLQFKNYYELGHIPSDELIAEYLPEINLFKNTAQFQDNVVKFSLVLGQKLSDKKETKYFHVKFGANSPYVIQPKPAFIRLLEEKSPWSGISYEYTGKTVAKKHYLYIENKTDIAKVLALNKIKNVNPDDLEHLECYYTDNDFKVNLIYIEPGFKQPIFEPLDDDTQKTYVKVLNFLADHDKKVWYVGLCKSKKFSVYFTCTDDKDFIEHL